MKFWLQSTVDLDRSPGYGKILQAAADRVLDDGHTVEVFGMPQELWNGVVPSVLERSPRAYFEIMSDFFLDRVYAAEWLGFDGFIQGSYSEPFLRESRSIVDIPVVSMVEASMLAAAAVAPKFGIVTMNKTLRWMQVNHVANHEMEARVTGIHTVEPEQDEDSLERLVTDRQAFLDVFEPVARRAIAEGADAILPAHGQLAALATAHDVTQIDGAAVVNGTGVSVLHAIALAKAYRLTGLTPGRRWGHQKPPAPVLSHLQDRAREVASELGLGATVR